MRPPSVSRDEVINRLATIFRSVGFERATLSELSRTVGLQRSSLYHLFPGGKTQMAKEVLDRSNGIFDNVVLRVLEGPQSPRERFETMARSIQTYYRQGRDGCLLGAFALEMPSDEFGDAIRKGFRRWIDLLARLFRDHGLEPDESLLRAREVVALIQGALVISRGLGSKKVFNDMMRRLPDQVFRESNFTGLKARAMARSDGVATR